LRPSNAENDPIYKGKATVKLLELDVPPHLLFASLVNKPGSIFLDSAMIDRYGLGRWSFIAYDPLFIMSSRADTVAFRIGKNIRWEKGNVFEALRRTLAQFEISSAPSWIPFRGGAAGFFGYELGRMIERLPNTVIDDQDIPQSWLGFYDTVLAYDHLMEQWFLCHTDFGLRRLELEDRLSEIRKFSIEANNRKKEEPAIVTSEFGSNFERDEYLKMVEKGQEYILKGDIYQVNLSQRFSVKVDEGTPWQLYERLRDVNAAPFAAYIQAGDFQVLSSSPERFLRVNGERVETRPIKGTRPRGSNPREDSWYKAKLLASEKDRAELNMIVDLERNDLGRVCDYGKVKVTRHAQCESYARVHHLVSTVEGELRKDCDVVDLLKATFPGGSITGAPKIRSMEIIDELEPCERGVYTGSIGYIGYDGEMDLNIAIRTMVMKDKWAHFSAGGGIIFDSDPSSEYDETYDKASAIIQALGRSIGGF
jgi:para-aminobenzoate synthetase component I